MEIDSAKDLHLARRMAEPDGLSRASQELKFPSELNEMELEASSDEPDVNVEGDSEYGESRAVQLSDTAHLAGFRKISSYSVENAFAVQNWGRSGSTFLQSLFDDHPQVLSTPNFYSRHYYTAWAGAISRAPDSCKIDTFLEAFRPWWDTGRVDATAGLHRLGPERLEIAGVARHALEGYLRAAFADGRPITRRSLFEAGHLAYALARGQEIVPHGLQILFPIHGHPRGTACALLEDFPRARFFYTLREPVANVASSIEHMCVNNFDLQTDPIEWALIWLFARRTAGYPRSSTRFLDRPYLPYLLSSDRVRGLRLEDLHSAGSRIMSAAAAWLGLVDNERLVQSTWDGKRWRNRPEIGRDSSLGTAPGERNVDRRLGGLDQIRIGLLLAKAPHLQAAYPGAGSVDQPSWVLRLTALVTPWRQEVRTRQSDLRSLDALLTFAPIWPKQFTAALKAAWRREHYRARLLTMNAGTRKIRENLPDARKSRSIQAVLIVTPLRDFRWRTRALIGGGCDLERPDRLGVAFLDEASGERSLRHTLFWLVILTAGRCIAHLRTYVHLRLLMFELVFRRRSEIARLPLLTSHDQSPAQERIVHCL